MYNFFCYNLYKSIPILPLPYQLNSPVQFFNFFSNFWRFWYDTKAHIFLITHAKFHCLKVFCLEEINKNVPGYGNHN